MDWLVLNNKYLEYLRSVEGRIPKTDYGTDKFKPFFGSLFEVGDLIYVTQVSSPKERHYKLPENKDFLKLYHPKNPDRLISVVNLNYMFPVPKSEMEIIKNYKSIDVLRTFKDEKDRSRYINLLATELKQINKKDIAIKAVDLYKIKKSSPNSTIARRCLNYIELESKAQEWIKINEKSMKEAAASQENIKRNKIKNHIMDYEMER